MSSLLEFADRTTSEKVATVSAVELIVGTGQTVAVAVATSVDDVAERAVKLEVLQNLTRTNSIVAN